jgi:hypothetical protein
MTNSTSGMIASTLITTKNLPFEIKHCVLGATCAKNPKSDLGKAMAAYLKTVQTAGKKPDPREMSEVMTKVRRTKIILANFCLDLECSSFQSELL